MSKQIPVSHMAFVRARAGTFARAGCAPERADRAVPRRTRLPELCLAAFAMRSRVVAGVRFLGQPAGHDRVLQHARRMEVFAELVQELVVNSLDFHTFKDVSAAQALAPVRGSGTQTGRLRV